MMDFHTIIIIFYVKNTNTIENTKFQHFLDEIFIMRGTLDKLKRDIQC